MKNAKITNICRHIRVMVYFDLRLFSPKSLYNNLRNEKMERIQSIELLRTDNKLFNKPPKKLITSCD